MSNRSLFKILLVVLFFSLSLRVSLAYDFPQALRDVYCGAFFNIDLHCLPAYQEIYSSETNNVFDVAAQSKKTLTGLSILHVQDFIQKGDKGDKGDSGPRGFVGEKGSDGDTGATGDKGEKGEKGDDGDSSSGSGLVSINGSTIAAQTFVVGNSGSDFSINSLGGINTLNLPDASISARGLVTTTTQTFGGVKKFEDNTIFNNSARFLTVSDPSHIEGLLYYSATDKALTYYNDESDIHINIGEDIVERVKNQTGSTVFHGQLVYVNGSDGSTPTIALANSSMHATTHVLGMASHDIENGGYGYISAAGIVHNLDTSSFSEGDPVYLSSDTDGAFTNTPPSVPNHVVLIGYVSKSNGSSGEVLMEVNAPSSGAFPTGSIPFGKGVEHLNADVANLFWDSTTKRLGIGDSTPTATLSVGSGDLFQVFGASGNITSQGDIALTTGGGSITATGGGLSLSGAGASSFSTTSGGLTLQVAGSSATSVVQIGVGGAGSITPDILGLDVKSTSGDPTGAEGYIYYNTADNKFRCYEDSGWKDCDAADVSSLQSSYNNGATITTAGSTDIALTLTSGNFTATGAGAVNLTPTSSSSFTSGGALTFTAGTASMWSTSTGDLTVQAGSGTVSLGNSTNLNTNSSLAITSGSGNIVLQPSGAGTVAVVQIGVGGVGNTSPDFLGLAVKSSSGDPAGGAEGYMYYNTSDNKFRCYVGSSWVDCDTTGGTVNLQTAYNAGNSISTNGSNIAFTLNSTDQFTASGAGAVNLTPTSSSSFTSGGALTLTAGSASTWGTTSGGLTLQAAGSGTTSAVQIGVGGAGSITPDILGLDVKSTSGDPTGFNGAMYYNSNLGKFRCYENSGWKDCDTGIAVGSLTLQQAYIAGSSITTAGATDLALILSSGNLTASGAGAVNLTPTSASSFTSGGALTFTAGAASTWGTTSGGLTLQAAGSSATSVVQIGVGGIGSTTPDFFALDVKSSSGDPVGGAEGYMYYNTSDNKFRCYENSGWKDCDTGGSPALQAVYNNGATITTAGSTDIALTLTSGNFTASGAGAVNLTPTSSSSFTSGGALTFTAGSASTWKTTSGNLTIDAASVLNLGTVNATGLSIGSTGINTTVNGPLIVSNYADFNTPSNPSHNEGRLFYDQSNHALSYYLDESEATLNIGEESYVRVKNASGVTITNGSVVYISGSDGISPQVSLARANVSSTNQALGISTHDIENNTYGYITTFGLVRDLDTSSYSSGAPIYVSETTAGQFTTTRPAQPNYTVQIGYVAKSDATNGEVLVTVSPPHSGAFSQGNIAFGNSVGDLISDSANLFWDDSNNRLGIGDSTPAATLSIGNGDLFEVFGSTGNVTTAGDITLGIGGGLLSSTGGALTITSAGSSVWSTSTGSLTINSATTNALTLDSATTGDVNLGNGANAKTINIGNSTDTTAVNVNTGTGGLTVVTATSGVVSIKSGTTGSVTLDSGTTGAVNIGNSSNSKTITIGNTTGTTSVNISSGTGNINFQSAGISTTGNIQIGAGGSGSATPDFLVLDTKNTAGDPTGTNGAMYYNSNLGKFRCFQNSSWKDCIHNASVDSVNDTSITSPTPGSYPALGTAIEVLTPTRPSLTPTSTTSRILVIGSVEYSNPSGGEDTNAQVSVSVRRGSGSCAGTLVGSTMTSFISDPVQSHWIPFSFIDSPSTISSQAYTVCAALSDGNGAAGTNATIPQVMLSIQEISASGADLAEIYSTNDSSIVPGDVVSLDSSLEAGVQKSISAYDKSVLGVVSVMPGLTIGNVVEEGNKVVPIALSGRVPVKVTTENGSIKVGDSLTASSIPGVAMRATKAGPIIGMAMQDFDTDHGLGFILMFVNTGYFNGINTITPSTINALDAEDSSRVLLAMLMENVSSSSPTAVSSEIFTDRIIAGLEVITPKVTTEELIATKIKVGQIEGLKEYLDDTTNDIVSKSENSTSDLIKNTFKSMTDFFNKVIFHKEVTFLSHATFNNDAGGFAVVKEGTIEVTVTFDEEYQYTPIVVGSPDQPVVYSIKDVNKKGFKIQIEEVKSEDIHFSWTATAIKEAKTFENDLPEDSEKQPTSDSNSDDNEEVEGVSENIPELLNMESIEESTQSASSVTDQDD